MELSSVALRVIWSFAICCVHYYFCLNSQSLNSTFCFECFYINIISPCFLSYRRVHTDIWLSFYKTVFHAPLGFLIRCVWSNNNKSSLYSNPPSTLLIFVVPLLTWRRLMTLFQNWALDFLPHCIVSLLHQPATKVHQLCLPLISLLNFR